MAGSWNIMNKTLSGAYINVRSVAQLEREFQGREGILALPFPLEFGDLVSVITLNDLITDASLGKIGLSLRNSDKDIVKYMVQALKGAQELIVFNSNVGGDKAFGEIGGIAVTAAKAGKGGNEIAISVAEVGDKFEVKVIYEGNTVDTQIVATETDLKDNQFVTFGAVTNFAVATATKLTGGANGNVDLTDYITEVANKNPSLIFLESISSAELTEIERILENGNKIRVLVGDAFGGSGLVATELDNEYISYIKPDGFVDEKGVSVDKDICYFVAGQSAGAGRSNSLTYLVIPFIVGSTKPALSIGELEDLSKTGAMVIHQRFNGDYVLERDRNTLKTFTAEKAEVFSDNKVLRVLIDIHDEVRNNFEMNYLGKVQNQDNGRVQFKGDVVKYVSALEAEGSVENFNSTTDVVVGKGNDVWSMRCDLYIQVTGTLEKLYMEVFVTDRGGM